MLPYHLRNLARVGDEVQVEVEGPVTVRSTLDALEASYPVLRGTIRDHGTLERRPFLRFFACQEDLSHDPPDTPLPQAIVSGAEPFMIVGAISGGSGDYVVGSTSAATATGLALVVSPVTMRRR